MTARQIIVRTGETALMELTFTAVRALKGSTALTVKTVSVKKMIDCRVYKTLSTFNYWSVLVLINRQPR